jgi:hypothetical protein
MGAGVIKSSLEFFCQLGKNMALGYVTVNDEHNDYMICILVFLMKVDLYRVGLHDRRATPRSNTNPLYVE